MSRLSVSVDPAEALKYAAAASELGDVDGSSIEAYILDYCSNGNPSREKIGRDRLNTASQLLVKLDPIFAFHSNDLQQNVRSGFISFIFGKYDFAFIFC